MDPRRFDALARSLVGLSSRRQVLAGLLAPLLPALGVEAKRQREAGKRREKAKDRSKGNDKKKRKQRKKRARSEAAPGCCSTGNCAPGAGKNLTRCCFENQTLTGKSFKGSNLTEANFSGANLTNAKFQSSNLTRACLVDATITGANFKGANLSGVIRCRTIINAAGDQDNSGCQLGTPCCPTCTSDTQCGPGEVCLDGRCVLGDCAGEPDGTPCADGRRCCDEVCPPPPTCLPRNACCENLIDCAARCCSGHATFGTPTCPNRFSCSGSGPEDSCGQDSDCLSGSRATLICICGRCCGLPGSICDADQQCCSGSCNLQTLECQPAG